MSAASASLEQADDTVRLLTDGRGETLRQLSVEQILGDGPSLRLILDATGERLRTVAEAESLFFHTPLEGELVFLVDFDVLRTFLEVENFANGGALAREIAHFFLHSEAKYAIPWGAFLELEEQLVELLGLNTKPTLEGDVAADPVERIAQILGLDKDVLFSDHPYVESVLDRSILRLSRLISILGNRDRFVGVRKLPKSDELRYAQSILQRQSGRRTDREKNNERDATNLAIVLNQLRQNSSSGEEESACSHYLLLTTTTAVLNAGRELREASQGYWVAVSPRQLVIPNIFGLVDDRKINLFHLTSIKNDLRAFHDAIAMHIPHASPKGRLTPISELVQQRVAELAGKLRQVIGTFRHEYLSVEALRATTIAIDEAHEKQHFATSLSTRTEQMTKHVAFLRLLDRFTEVFGAIPGVEYESREVSAPGVRRFCTYEINRHSGTPLSFGETGIALRIYMDRTGAAPEYWSANWNITCDERKFALALSELFPHPKDLWGSQIDADEKVGIEAPVKASSKLWKKGVVITTAAKTYGFSPKFVARHGYLEFLELSGIQTSILGQYPKGSEYFEREIRKKLLSGGISRDPYWKRSLADVETLAEIQEIRVNSSFGDFVFEVTPIESMANRSVTVISKMNLSKQIATLYDWLGTRLARKETIQTTCQSIIGRYFLTQDNQP